MHKRRSESSPFISNWVERLKHLNRLREKQLGVSVRDGANKDFSRSQSVDPRIESGIASPGSLSISSLASSMIGPSSSMRQDRNGENNRPRSTTISNLNKAMFEGGLTLTEPDPDPLHLHGHSRGSFKVADDFTHYT